ncbi:hypothetical protein A6P39_002325 [Streptomyces sp. FXJ1.172]|uniref:hypothetical protein n=1 Tax=Streptomyces sp. FXJ1.172 TaxID=710705 RepID=UPI000AB04354|nr:hypothetical protein [Streptomyces sp. FXJ1.172]WEO93014.1 hypothetical protein A6P39_002325 [Streptomyces sp. FXJ1.172]
MSIPVHALVQRPLTTEAVAELLALPDVSRIPEEFDAVDEELRRRGWEWQHKLVCDSFRTGHGHVLCSDYGSPFGEPDARCFLVFGEIYPVDPGDEDMRNEEWLNGYIEGWQQLPGWTCRRPSTDQDCEAVLAQAARAVTEHLGTVPERILVSAAVAAGPALTHRIWRTATHALVLGPAEDHGPYGYLTHLRLSCTPLGCGPDLPPASDEDALVRWIVAHTSW